MTPRHMALKLVLHPSHGQGGIGFKADVSHFLQTSSGATGFQAPEELLVVISKLNMNTYCSFRFSLPFSISTRMVPNGND